MLYYSYRVEDEKKVDFEESSYKIVFGKAHYSYKIAAKKFLTLLEQNYNLLEIIRPEIYKDKLSFKYLKNFQINGVNTHLIFKPIEHINPLKNAKNIGIFAWEFDKLNDKDLNGNPFLNQIKMLKLLDEIWVPSTYTKKILNSYGFKNVYFIPAPISSTVDFYDVDLEKLIGNMICVTLNAKKVNEQALKAVKENINLSKIKKTYFSILNPWDYRKNLPGLLKTFIEFSKNHDDVLLIIKVIIDNKTTFLNNINEILYLNLHQKNLKSDNIIFISEYIPQKTLYSIMKKVDYYYNLSFAEGQFLPILESMILGTVPISPNNTAMEDYITEENSLLVSSNITLADSKANVFKRDDFSWYEPNLINAIERLEESYYLEKNDYKRKSDRSCLKVKEVYGTDVIFEKVKDRLNG